MARVHITDYFLRKLRKGRQPDAPAQFYYDTDLRGFGVKVTPLGDMSFITEGRVRRGRTRRIKVGPYPTLTLKEAKQRARVLLSKMHSGEDPVESERKRKEEEARERAIEVAKSKSLGEVWDEFLEHRGLKPKTLTDYKSCFNVCFGDWLKVPVRDITRKLIETRFHKLVKERGRAQGQKAMRILSSALNWAKADEVAEGERLIRDNPVDVLKEKRLRKVLKPRTNSIPLDQLGEFVYTVQAVSEPSSIAFITADFVLFLLLTGLRREEALQLRWSDVNYARKYLSIEDTKNGLDHYVPLSDRVRGILRRRIMSAHYTGHGPLDLGDPEFREAVEVSMATEDPQEFDPEGTKLAKLQGWVFPSEITDGPLREPRRIVQDIRERSGINFTLHDLRRTFASICFEIGLDHRTTKRVMNHKQRDVTETYIQTNIEQLRAPMQQVATFVQRAYEETLRRRIPDKVAPSIPEKVVESILQGIRGRTASNR